MNDRSSSYICLIGADQFLRERSLVAAIRYFKEDIAIFSPNAPMENNPFADIILPSSPYDVDNALEATVNYFRETGRRPAAVVSVNDFGLNTALKIAEKFDLPSLSEKTILTCRNKYQSKKALSAGGLKVAKIVYFECESELVTAAGEVGFPLVIKPIDFGGSGGVKKAHNLIELKEAFSEAKDLIGKYGSQYNSKSAFVLESYIAGDAEVSVEVLTGKNVSQALGITYKCLGPEPYFPETGHIFPYQPADEGKIKDIALKACATLGVNKGIAHVELKKERSSGDWYVIEVGCRPAGDGIIDLVSKSIGKNLYHHHIASFFPNYQDALLPATTYKKKSAIQFITFNESKVLQNFNSEVIKSFTNPSVKVVSASIKLEAGESVVQVCNWSTRYGHIQYSLEDHVDNTTLEFIHRNLIDSACSWGSD